MVVLEKCVRVVNAGSYHKELNNWEVAGMRGGEFWIWQVCNIVLDGVKLILLSKI